MSSCHDPKTLGTITRVLGSKDFYFNLSIIIILLINLSTLLTVGHSIGKHLTSRSEHPESGGLCRPVVSAKFASPSPPRPKRKIFTSLSLRLAVRHAPSSTPPISPPKRSTNRKYNGEKIEQWLRWPVSHDGYLFMIFLHKIWNTRVHPGVASPTTLFIGKIDASSIHHQIKEKKNQQSTINHWREGFDVKRCAGIRFDVTS